MNQWYVLLMASSELKPLHLLVMTGDDSATCGLLKEGSGSEAFLNMIHWSNHEFMILELACYVVHLKAIEDRLVEPRVLWNT
jgi:hypothetical protein